MMTKFMLSGAAALALLATPAISQTAGMMTAADVGVSPMTGTSATDYVKLAADSDRYEIESSRVALTKSKREDVKGFAKQMIQDHMMTTKSLMAALNNDDRKIAPPSTMLSSDNKAKVTLLKKAPKGTFDQLYLQQQLQSHQMAWALNKGYATEGTDPALKQVATTAVPVIEQHLAHAKALAGPAAAM